MDASSGFDLFSSFLHSDLMCSELFAKPFAATSSAPAAASAAASSTSLVPSASAPAASAGAPSASAAPPPSLLSNLDPLAFARQAQAPISLNEADLGAVTALARAALPSPQFFGQPMAPNESLSLFADSHSPAYLSSGLATGLGLYPSDLSSLPISSLFPGSTDATAGLLSLLNSSRAKTEDLSVGATVGRSAFTPKSAGSLPSFSAPAASSSTPAAPSSSSTPAKGAAAAARGTKRKAGAASTASPSPTASTARSVASTPRSQTSSPDGTVHSAAETEDEKTQRRRLRERESARRCRQRKQNLISDLEAQVKQLKAENDSLRQMQERSRIEYLVQERERLLLTVETLLTSARLTPSAVEPQLAAPLAALEKNSNAMRDLLKRDMEVLPLFLEMSQLRNVILWMLLAPMEASRLQQIGPQTPTPAPSAATPAAPTGPAAGPAAPAPAAAAAAAAGSEDTESIVMTVERINQQLQKEIGFSPQQVEAIGDFRTKWQDAIRRAFEGNRVVIDLLGAFEKNKRAIATYHTVLSRVREDVFAILSPTQQARMQVWLFKHKNLLKCLLSAPRFPSAEGSAWAAPSLPIATVPGAATTLSLPGAPALPL